LIPIIVVAVGGICLFNVLGESNVFNSPELIYSNKDPVTG